MLASLYRRVSTDHQEGSLAVQETKLDAYLTLKGLESHPAAVFADEDTSGAIPIWDRPGGRQLCDILERGLPPPPEHFAAGPTPIKHLVVAKLDRLGRNARDLLELLEWLNARDITLHIVDLCGDSLASQGAAGKLMFGLLAQFAEFERELIRDRVQQRLDDKFARHEVIGTVPFGFTETPGPDGKRLLVPNPTEQTTIRLMHSLRQQGWKYGQIATHLNQHGIPTKTGKHNAWQTGNVKKVLESKHTTRLLAAPTQPSA